MNKEKNRRRMLNRQLNEVWGLTLNKVPGCENEDVDMNYWINDNESKSCDSWPCKDLDEVEFFIKVGDIVDYFLMREEAHKIDAMEAGEKHNEEGRKITGFKNRYNVWSRAELDVIHKFVTA